MDEFKSLLTSVLKPYENIELSALREVSLLNRIDTKYILSRNDLLQFLRLLSKDYQLLKIQGFWSEYETEYFDTPSRDMFQQHQRGKANRYKIRTRKYVDSGDAYFEVKHKDNKGVTHKYREPFQNQLAESHGSLVTEKTIYHQEELEPQFTSRFRRITLKAIQEKERLTIDFDLQFVNGEENFDLPNLVIVEVKKSGEDIKSRARIALKSIEIHPTSFSKYCLGQVLVGDNLHHNYKPVLLKLKKLELL